MMTRAFQTITAISVNDRVVMLMTMIPVSLIVFGVFSVGFAEIVRGLLLGSLVVTFVSKVARLI